jgi:hypothetical protein
MDLIQVSSNISPIALAQAKENLSKLMTELALNNTNKNIGSALGGNNFQLLVLAGLKHELSTESETKVNGDTIVWSELVMAHSSITEIRYTLDAMFPSIVEKNKLMALAMQTLADSQGPFHKAFEDNKHNFPNVLNALDNLSSINDMDLSYYEQMIVAFILCSKMSFDLDQVLDVHNILTWTKVDNKIAAQQSIRFASQIDALSFTLMGFDPGIVLFSIRKHIGLQRVVCNGLDENKLFNKVLMNVSKVLGY